MNSNKFIVIIPTYNEKNNICQLIKELNKYSLSVLVVDDNSPDGTADEVMRLSKEYNNVDLLKRDSKLGLGSAYREGFAYALSNNYEFLIQMDADFSHSVQDLLKMINNIDDSDLLIGSRYVEGGLTSGWAISRQILSKSANMYAKVICNYDVKDSTSGFRIYSSSSLAAINYQTTNTDGYSWMIEMTYRTFKKGLKIKEFPIGFHERREGSSKLSKKIILEALLLVPKLRFNKRY